MSYAESPILTVEKFAQTSGWKNATTEELTNDLFSISRETNLEWDQFIYEEKNNKLFDPLRGYVVGSANGDTVEEDVNIQLEKWFFANDSGLAVWISPRGGEIRPYPEEKIVIYKIAYELTGKKVLLGASHQFKTLFENPENLRRFIFTENDKEESVFEIINWLNNISEKKVGTSSEQVEEIKKQAEYYAHQYKAGVSINELVYHMALAGFLGTNPISCGSGATQTALGVMSIGGTLPNFSEVMKFVRNCGNCGAAINSVISAGYRCSGCGGVYQGC